MTCSLLVTLPEWRPQQETWSEAEATRLKVFGLEWDPLLVFRLCLCSLLGRGDSLLLNAKQVIQADGM